MGGICQVIIYSLNLLLYGYRNPITVAVFDRTLVTTNCYQRKYCRVTMNCTVDLSVEHDGTRWGEDLCVLGDLDALGAWKTPVALKASPFPVWRLQLQLPACTKINYKYVLCTSKRDSLVWEPIAGNRTLTTIEAGSHIIVSDEKFGNTSQTSTRASAHETEAVETTKQLHDEAQQVEKDVALEGSLKVTELNDIESMEKNVEMWRNSQTPTVSCVSIQSSADEWEPNSPPTEKASDDGEESDAEKVTVTNEIGGKECVTETIDKVSPISVICDEQFTPQFETKTQDFENSVAASPSTPKNCIRRQLFTTTYDDSDSESVSVALEETAALAADACMRLRRAMPVAAKHIMEESARDATLDETVGEAVEKAREVQALMCKLREMIGKRETQGSSSESSPLAAIRTILSEMTR